MIALKFVQEPLRKIITLTLKIIFLKKNNNKNL